MDDNVLLFPRAPDDTVVPPVERERKRRYGADVCHHQRTLVLDEQAHQLRCNECAQVLDPFDWMVNHVGKWEHANVSYRQARQQAAQAADELLVLERKVKARRAAVRRAGVLLTAGDARLLRDQYNRLSLLVLDPDQ